MDLFLSLLYSLALIAFVVVIFLSFNKYMKMSRIKMILLIFLFTSGFTLYYIGHYGEGIEIIAASRAFFSSVQMIVLNNNFETMTNPLITESSWGIPLLSIISIFIFAIVAQTIVFTVFKDIVAILTIRYSKQDHIYLFDGYSETFKPMFDQLNKDKKLFYFVADGEEKQKIYDLGYLSISSKRNMTPLFKNTHVFVFLLSDDELSNVKKAQLWIERDLKKHPLYLYIRTQHEQLSLSFPKLYVDHITIHVIDETDIMMRDILKSVPLEKYLPIDPEKVDLSSPFQAFIGGFTPLGEAFYKHLVIQTQSKAYKPVIYLHDENIEYAWGMFQTKNNQVDQCSTTTLIQEKIGSLNYFEKLFATSDLHYIIFAYPSSEVNIDLSTTLYQRLNQMNKPIPPILCYVKDYVRRQYLKTLPIYQDKIYFMGGLDDIMNLDDLIHLRIDHEAKRYHEAYEQERKRQSERLGQAFTYSPYENQPPFIIKSNRAVIDHLAIKLKLLGLSIHEVIARGFDDTTFDNYAHHINPKAFEILSEIEHLRWNAFYFLNGWVTRDLNQVKVENEDGSVKYITKDYDKRNHACLISFTDLAKLNELTGNNYYAHDLNNIKNIPTILRDVHQ